MDLDVASSSSWPGIEGSADDQTHRLLLLHVSGTGSIGHHSTAVPFWSVKYWSMPGRPAEVRCGRREIPSI